MYKARNIQFRDFLKIGDWRIKSYTISEKDKFDSAIVYSNAIDQLPEWLEQLNSFDSRHDHTSFLIIHEAKGGVFSLINTWVGGNMLQTHIFITRYHEENVFTKISGDGLFACVWELAIIDHERKAWLKHILQQDDKQDFDSYLKDVINTRF